MQINTFFKTLSAAALAIVLAACGGQKDSAPAASAASSADNGAEKKEIVFGTTVGDFGDMVKDQIQPALEKKGYKVKLIEFTDYVRPNLALAEGELDINIFQHKPYLDDFKKEHKLSMAHIINPAEIHAEGKIVFGTTVTLEDLETEEQVTYQIVGEDEADIKERKIYVGSPIARALIGKEEGDVAEVQAPGGVREYDIIAVQYI